MIELTEGSVYLVRGNELIPAGQDAEAKIKSLCGRMPSPEEAKKQTIAYGILSDHSRSGDENKLKIVFDAMASHDITYVGIIQTARASGLSEFPIPYVLTNCHNSLCAVGGTINEDDHLFGLSAAKKYGGIYVPAHIAVIHSYMREKMSACGSMILGSDSHTRYGALGTMAVGEGGPELVKQLLGRTWDIDRPDVIAVRLTGAPKPGVGPQDVALALIGAVFEKGFVKNKVLEFVGDGIKSLPIEFRNGIDVMTTETTCLSSIWLTDGETERYFENHGRPEAFCRLAPGEIACYDGAVSIDLSEIEPMIALPFHPSNVYPIRELIENAGDIFREVEKKTEKQFPGLSLKLTDKITKNGILVDQGVIAGCAGGTVDNLTAAADILAGHSTGNGSFSLSAYPASQPTYLNLMKSGAAAELMTAGVTLRTAFCGPCFGAGDVPSNGALSIRHSTRNFPNREGSKPGDGQLAAVALMDARSIAATARNGGILTPATDLDIVYRQPDPSFDDTVYRNRVYNGFPKADPKEELVIGPNIADWPTMPALPEHLLLGVASVITDPVTTTDELIPSGETSSYRSNPKKLASFALSRKDPGYVDRAKAYQFPELAREAGEDPLGKELAPIAAKLSAIGAYEKGSIGFGSLVCANKPGDGSAREQAASCQKVLGGFANIAVEYATKRYRSNLINWGMLPLLAEKIDSFTVGDYLFLPGIREAIKKDVHKIKAYLISGEKITELSLALGAMTPDERQILLDGCLINYYKNQK